MSLLHNLYEAVLEHSKAEGYHEAVILGSVIVLALVAFGFLIGWVVSKNVAVAGLLKTLAERQKTKTDADLALASLLAQIEERRTGLLQQKIQLDEHMKDIRSTLQANRVRPLADLRNQLCALYENEFLPALQRYLDDCLLLLPKRVKYARVAGEVIPVLSVQVELLDMINHERFMEKVRSAARFEVNPRFCNLIFWTARKCIPWYRRKDRRELKALKASWSRHLKPKSR